MDVLWRLLILFVQNLEHLGRPALVLALIVVPSVIPQEWTQSGPSWTRPLRALATSPLLALVAVVGMCAWTLLFGRVGSVASPGYLWALALVLYFYLAYIVVRHTGMALLIAGGILGIGAMGLLVALAQAHHPTGPENSPHDGAFLASVFAPAEYVQERLVDAQRTREELRAGSPLPGYAPGVHRLDIKHVAWEAEGRYRVLAARYGDGRRCLLQFRFTEAGRVLRADSSAAVPCQQPDLAVFPSFAGSAGEFVAFQETDDGGSPAGEPSVVRIGEAPGRALRSIVRAGHTPLVEIHDYGYLTRYDGEDQGRPVRIVRYDGTVNDRILHRLAEALRNHDLALSEVRAARRMPEDTLRFVAYSNTGILDASNRRLLFVSVPLSGGSRTTQEVDLEKGRHFGNRTIAFERYDVKAVMLADGSLIARADVGPAEDRQDRDPLDLIRIAPDGTLDAAFYRRASQFLQGHTVHELWQVGDDRIVLSIAEGVGTHDEIYTYATDGLLAITPTGRIDCGFRSPVPSLHVSVGCQADPTAGAEASVP